ncbi:tRNA-dihydrouridine(20/20a) synthase [Candidatus Ecksteinia adelgidicola]|nr:tRNA-dihydrouridine(20/20a) synthase [Candidatus Ecksteinia adelgidicola]
MDKKKKTSNTDQQYKSKFINKNNNFYHFSIAPMLRYTDRHCRYFYRLMTKKTLLYTEMITTSEILNSTKHNYLLYNIEEHPVVAQLGGSNPTMLAKCAKIIEKYNYDEINLNVGCPSKKMKHNILGAYLMMYPKLVADCIKAMQDVVNIPITIKTRIGIDNHDSYEHLYQFVSTIFKYSQCCTFIIHARKACLSGLTPKKNRKIPPLNYQRVYQLKNDFPFLRIIINGEIKTLEEIQKHLQHLDGVMIGREVYQNPSILMKIDNKIFGSRNIIKDRIAIIKSLYPYIEHELSNGIRLNNITRHMINMFKGIAGSRQWRRYISENSCNIKADIRVIERALNYIET